MIHWLKSEYSSRQVYRLDQSQVDNIVKEMAMAGLDEHMSLARMAVEETGRGVYEDKTIKIFLQQSMFTTASNMIKPSE